MTLCDKCVLKNDCKMAEFFGEGKLPLAHCKQHVPVPVGQQEDVTEVMTGVTEETYEQAIHMFDNAKERKTNFDRITESPETLAEFIIDKLQYCKRPVCPICPVWQQCDGNSKDSFIEWLKQESE